MSTVDEILASGRYTDRRGREWCYDTKHRFWLATPGFIAGWKVTDFGGPIDDAQMRLLIERDQHRDVCHRRGASNCIDHPVPIVYWNDREDAWMARPAGGWPPHEDVPLYFDLPEAMDAARALVVEP